MHYNSGPKKKNKSEDSRNIRIQQCSYDKLEISRKPYASYIKKDKIRLYLRGYISSEGENRFQSFPVPTERDVVSTAERLRKWI